MSDTRRIRPILSRGLAAALVLAVLTAFLAVVQGPAQADDSPFVVTMTPSSDPVASGSSLTYTIDVTNAGGDITQDTVLNTQISGMTGLILTSNVGGCTQTDNQVTCTAGILDGFSRAGGSSIRGTVTAPNGTTLFNGVTVTGNHESSGYETSVYCRRAGVQQLRQPAARPARQRPGPGDHRRRIHRRLPAHGQQHRQRQRRRRDAWSTRCRTA